MYEGEKSKWLLLELLGWLNSKYIISHNNGSPKACFVRLIGHYLQGMSQPTHRLACCRCYVDCCLGHGNEQASEQAGQAPMQSVLILDKSDISEGVMGRFCGDEELK